MTKGGRVWLLGDNIDTDVLAPGLYMKGPIDELARHCLEAVEPSFADNVADGDIIVAGANFGIGSSRDQASQVLKQLGIHAIVARSYGGIFYRNALNFGLLAVTYEEAPRVSAGDRLTIDGTAGRIDNLTTGETFECDSIPTHLMDMIAAGGLVPLLEQRLARERKEPFP